MWGGVTEIVSREIGNRRDAKRAGENNERELLILFYDNYYAILPVAYLIYTRNSSVARILQSTASVIWERRFQLTDYEEEHGKIER